MQRLLFASLLVVMAAFGSAACSETTPVPPEPRAEASSPPAPTPTRSTDRELAAALPRAAAELHSTKVQVQCRTMRTSCDGREAGAAFVIASTHGPDQVDVLVSVRQWEARAWKEAVQACPQGTYEKPLKRTSERSFQPGERGTSKRTPWTVGTWEGFICDRRGVFVWPENEPRSSGRPLRHMAYLNNGFHQLITHGRDLAETKLLASEYLARLEAE